MSSASCRPSRSVRRTGPQTRTLSAAAALGITGVRVQRSASPRAFADFGGEDPRDVRNREMFRDAAAMCTDAFQAGIPARCQDAMVSLGPTLAKTRPKALGSPEAARFCALFVALLYHPVEECRQMAVSSAGKAIDVALFLRFAPKTLVCELDPARRLQVVENLLKAARAILSTDAALDRCRQSGGLITIIDVWRSSQIGGDVAREAMHLILLFAPCHSKAVASAGCVEMAIAVWTRLLRDESVARNPLQGAVGVETGAAGPSLSSNSSSHLGLVVELMIWMLPHTTLQRLQPVSTLAEQSLRATQIVPLTRTHEVLLQLVSKMCKDASLARDLMNLGTHEAVLRLLTPDTSALQHAVAHAWIQIVAGAAPSRRQLSLGPPSVEIGAPIALRFNRVQGLPVQFAVNPIDLDVPPTPLLAAPARTEALRKEFLALGTLAQTVVYPGRQCGDEFLLFDANFEGANLRCVMARSSTDYEVQLSADANSSHVQWFYWRMTGMTAGVKYKFRLINLVKQRSLFEDGAQPVMLSRCLMEEGVGWRHVGDDIAYYPNGALLSNGKPAHTLSFSISFTRTDDDVFLAHYFPYVYSDVRQDLERWQAGAQCSELLKTPGGLSVPVCRVGAPPGTKPVVVVIARAHPGEVTGSWVMRGVCDFLFLDEDSAGCRAALTWVLVPMLNPDGVVLGNTRTNLGGVDLNRHHHDDAAPETAAFRTLFSAAGASPLAFVDLHGHSCRRGVFCMGNAGASERLMGLLANHSPAFDLAGSAMLPARSKDVGVGRVVGGARCSHSFTLEAAFGVPSSGDIQMTPRDLQGVGRALCRALCELSEDALA